MARFFVVMVKNKHFITNRVADLVEPILDEMAFELVNVEYLSKHGKWILRLYIDKEGGVTISGEISWLSLPISFLFTFALSCYYKLRHLTIKSL